jgi:nicotinamidase-related amidase
MPAKNPDLHGNVPDKSPVALLLIDVINDMEWDGGPLLYRHALPMARRLARLKQRAREAGVPVIYVNDNFGKWRSDFRKLVSESVRGRTRGAPVIRLLKPDKDDYFVLKPKLSAFFATPLDLLLSYLEVKTLILTGVAGNLCVLYSAIEANLRDYHIVVPSDCVASNTLKANKAALEQMRTTLKARVVLSKEIDFGVLEKVRGLEV